jgi:steroid delta-isomerase-like uncharacterized protein
MQAIDDTKQFMEENKMSAQQNIALSQTGYDLFNNNDVDGVLALCTDDVVADAVGFGQLFHSQNEFGMFLGGFRTAFPDGIIQITNQVATENTVVNEFGFTGTHTGPLMTPSGELPPTDRHVEWRIIEVWEFKNGKLAVLRNYSDTATLMRQLGVM